MHRVILALAMCGGAYATDLTVGTATARPGERANGSIRVPAGSDAAVEIPVIAINGAKPGPTMALVAGAHGTEYASILALEEVAKRADPAAMSGALIVVPLLNLASFTQKVPHLNPVDGKNMNRFYPGKADGTQTERASLAITQQVVEKADYILDYHGGDLDENLRKYAYWADTGNARMDGIARGMVLAFGLDHIIIQRQSAAPGGPITLTRIAQQKGKPAIAVEAGHAGTTDAEDVEALADGTFRVMRHLKMLPGEVKAIEHPLWIARASVLASERDGIFHPLVVPEAYLTKGMRVGYVTDYFGNTVWEARAPVSGVVLYICAVPSMKKGDNVVDIGEIEP